MASRRKGTKVKVLMISLLMAGTWYVATHQSQSFKVVKDTGVYAVKTVGKLASR
jgi:hypothetical protein